MCLNVLEHGRGILLACPAGDQLPLASLPSPCPSPPFFCSFLLMRTLCLVACCGYPTSPLSESGYCPSGCPSQLPLAFLPASPGGLGQHLVWQGRNHKLAENPPQQPRGAACRHLSSCSLCPAHRTKALLKDPVAMGLRFLEAAGRGRGRECLPSACLMCMSGEGGGVLRAL